VGQEEMSNVHLALGVGLPALVVLTILVVSIRYVVGVRRDIREFREEIKDFEAELRDSN
jgi:hypothetical protein